MELAWGFLKLEQLSLSLSLHTQRPVPQPEWDVALAQLREHSPDGRFDAEHTRMLVLSDGGAPDASQRAQLFELWHAAEVKVAVMVPGAGRPEKRGVVTALHWVNPAVGLFTPDLFRQALEHLDLRTHEARIWRELQRLQAQLEPLQTLQLIAALNALPRLPLTPRPDTMNHT